MWNTGNISTIPHSTSLIINLCTQQVFLDYKLVIVETTWPHLGKNWFTVASYFLDSLAAAYQKVVQIGYSNKLVSTNTLSTYLSPSSSLLYLSSPLPHHCSEVKHARSCDCGKLSWVSFHWMHFAMWYAWLDIQSGGKSQRCCCHRGK